MCDINDNKDRNKKCNDPTDVWRYYLLPIIGAITYIILSMPLIDRILADWIPHKGYLIFVKAVIILLILFVFCRLIDICNS